MVILGRITGRSIGLSIVSPAFWGGLAKWQVGGWHVNKNARGKQMESRGSGDVMIVHSYSLNFSLDRRTTLTTRGSGLYRITTSLRPQQLPITNTTYDAVKLAIDLRDAIFVKRGFAICCDVPPVLRSSLHYCRGKGWEGHVKVPEQTVGAGDRPATAR